MQSRKNLGQRIARPLAWVTVHALCAATIPAAAFAAPAPGSAASGAVIEISDGSLIQASDNPLPPMKGRYEVGVVSAGNREMNDAHLRFQSILNDESSRAAAACHARGSELRSASLPARRVIYVGSAARIHVQRSGARLGDSLGNTGRMAVACVSNVGSFFASLFEPVSYDGDCDGQTVASKIQDQEINLSERKFAVWHNAQDASESALFVRMDDESLRAAAKAAFRAVKCADSAPAMQATSGREASVAKGSSPAASDIGASLPKSASATASSLSGAAASLPLAAPASAPIIPRPVSASGAVPAGGAVPAVASDRQQSFRKRGVELARQALKSCVASKSAINPDSAGRAKASLTALIKSDRGEISALPPEEQTLYAQAMRQGWNSGLVVRAASAATVDSASQVASSYRVSCASELKGAYPIKIAVAKASGVDAGSTRRAASIPAAPKPVATVAPKPTRARPADFDFGPGSVLDQLGRAAIEASPAF